MLKSISCCKIYIDKIADVIQEAIFGCPSPTSVVYMASSFRMAESAALSATLLEDWLDVTRNMDPTEFENLQKELDFGSPFPFEDF